MKVNLFIVPIGDEFVICSDHTTIKKGDKVFNSRSGSITKAESFDGSVGYTVGPGFLYFQKQHYKIVKYITQADLRNLCTRQRPIKWSGNNDTF
jgi:hypothetical protein